MKSNAYISALFAVALLPIVGCTHTSSDKDDLTPANKEFANEQVLSSSNTNLAIPDNSKQNTYRVLLFGNSHIRGLKPLLDTLVKEGAPDKTLTIVETGASMFLSDRLSHSGSMELLTKYQWSHVVLQGQKYSQSGRYHYPTSGAQTWIKLSKQHSATPILFPEHPQRGNRTEGQRIYQLHKDISQMQAACIAPVGLVWDAIIKRYPEINLYSPDGNHANGTGRLLTSLVYYQVITGNSADLLPAIESIQVSPHIQDIFGQVVDEIIQQYPACH